MQPIKLLYKYSDFLDKIGTATTAGVRDRYRIFATAATNRLDNTVPKDLPMAKCIPKACNPGFNFPVELSLSGMGSMLPQIRVRVSDGFTWERGARHLTVSTDELARLRGTGGYAGQGPGYIVKQGQYDTGGVGALTEDTLRYFDQAAAGTIYEANYYPGDPAMTYTTEKELRNDLTL